MFLSVCAACAAARGEEGGSLEPPLLLPASLSRLFFPRSLLLLPQQHFVVVVLSRLFFVTALPAVSFEGLGREERAGGRETRGFSASRAKVFFFCEHAALVFF